MSNELISWPTHTHRKGWRGAELSKADLTVTLSDSERGALLACVDGVKRLPLAAIELAHFNDPLLLGLMARVALEVKCQSGLAFLHLGGLDGMNDAETMRRVFWGLSLHLGQTLSQSGLGDHLGEVRARPGGARGYTSNAELHLHNDLSELFGLFCVQPAKAGGENRFVSMLAVYETLAREHKEFISILERGFRLDRSADSLIAKKEPYSPYRVPLFSTAEGLRSCWLTLPDRALKCAEALGEQLTHLERQALECVKAIVEHEDMTFRATLAKGEAVYVNNFEVVHARSPFIEFEAEEKRRHLLRIWLQADPSRPMRQEMLLYENPSGLQGMDADPERRPGDYARVQNT